MLSNSSLCNTSTLTQSRINNQSNIFGEFYEEEEDGKVFLTINTILSILIILVNSFVAFLFFYKKALLGKPSNKLLLSLSICDLLSGVAVVMHIVIATSPIFETECHSCFIFRIFTDIFTTFLVKTSVAHLCMITADRFLSLFFALRYRDLVTRSAINRFVIGGWVIPFVSATVQLTYVYPYFFKFPEELATAELEYISKIEVWYSVASFVVFMLIPFLLNGIAFISMFLEIRKLLLKTPSRRLQGATGVSSQQRRVIYIFGLMYLCFTTLVLPYFTLRLILDMQSYNKTHELDVPPIIFDIFYTCKISTSLCNPILYSALNREFRSIAGLWVKKRRQDICWTVQKLSITPVYYAAKRRSLRSSISDQGRPAYDSGIFEIQTVDTLTSNMLTPRGSVGSEVKQDDTKSSVSESAF